jgi:hypothetical protein
MAVVVVGGAKVVDDDEDPHILVVLELVVAVVLQRECSDELLLWPCGCEWLDSNDEADPWWL